MMSTKSLEVFRRHWRWFVLMMSQFDRTGQCRVVYAKSHAFKLQLAACMTFLLPVLTMSDIKS